MFSIEKEISEKMQVLGVAASFVCALSNVSPTTFSAAMRNLKPLPNETAIRILDLLADLGDLVDRVRPIPVALENPQVIRRLLDDIQDEKTDLGLTRKDPLCVLCAFRSHGAESVRALDLGTFGERHG
jgi:hypothetical protein